MNSSRTHDSRILDYEHLKDKDCLGCMRNAVTHFVRGIRGPREEGVTAKQIYAWFRGTSDAFVDQGIHAALASGQIECGPRSLTSTSRFNGVNLYYVSLEHDEEACR